MRVVAWRFRSKHDKMCSTRRQESPPSRDVHICTCFLVVEAEIKRLIQLVCFLIQLSSHIFVAIRSTILEKKECDPYTLIL